MALCPQFPPSVANSCFVWGDLSWGNNMGGGKVLPSPACPMIQRRWFYKRKATLGVPIMELQWNLALRFAQLSQPCPLAQLCMQGLPWEADWVPCRCPGPYDQSQPSGMQPPTLGMGRADTSGFACNRRILVGCLAPIGEATAPMGGEMAFAQSRRLRDCTIMTVSGHQNATTFFERSFCG